MKVCLICEGSYPYVSGGVSAWVQMLCQNLKDVEFVIWSIATTREEMSEYKYKLPENVKEVKTHYLGDRTFGSKHKKVRLSKEECELLRNLCSTRVSEVDWDRTLSFISAHKNHLLDLLMGEDFYHICLEEYESAGSSEVFFQYLWSFRSMYFPFMDVMTGEVPEADVYHTLSTGYAGLLASLASYITGKPMILSEHGIYTREREEDIIRSEWVAGGMKEYWISFFKKISSLAYRQASVVTSLFDMNRTLQVEIGCPPEKIRVIPNGVAVDDYKNLKNNGKLDPKLFQIGTVLRVVPIKDVKTMLLAFQEVREHYPDVHLSVLGGYDEEPEYYEECLNMIRMLRIENVTFCGLVDPRDYMAEFDLMLLSSISEGQPLALLEGMSAGIPFVCTNVGDCKELLEGGEGDTFGPAGRIVPVMDSDAMAAAILELIDHPAELKAMGEAGRKRADAFYRRESFLQKYGDLYQELGEI